MTFPAEVREQARYVYGADVDGYERGRPEYPQPVYDLLVSRCGLAPGVAVLEIGPGTGRVTRRLVAASARVVGVEPDPALVAHLAALRPEAEREALLDRIEAIVTDDFGGRVEHPIVTAVYTGRKP